MPSLIGRNIAKNEKANSYRQGLLMDWEEERGAAMTITGRRDMSNDTLEHEGPWT